MKKRFFLFILLVVAPFVIAASDWSPWYINSDNKIAPIDDKNVVLTSGSGSLTAGAGITGATGETYEATLLRVGNIVTTTIYIDLTTLHGTDGADEIIGKDGGTASCHIGQITATGTGTIIAGWIDTGEVPAGGDPDIDLYSATVSTGAQDAAIGDLTETLLCNSGDLAVGTRVNLTALPAANGYLYLVNGTATDAEYSAGKITITLIGHID